MKFQETLFMKKQKTFKSQVGKWEENRNFGKLGEDKLIEYFNKTKTEYMELNFNHPVIVVQIQRCGKNLINFQMEY